MRSVAAVLSTAAALVACGFCHHAEAHAVHSCVHDEVLSTMGEITSAEQPAHPEPHPDAEEVSPLHGRRLATHCGSQYCPIRVTVEYSPATLVPTGGLTAAKIATLQNDIIPAAVARLQEMYLVKPVAGRLTFSRTCQTLCSVSGDPRQGLCNTYADPASSPATCDLGDDGANNPWTVPLSYYGDQTNTCGGVTNNYPANSATPGVADSDFHLVIRADSGTRCSGGSTLAFAGTCQKDALTDRPLLGVANFCPSSISSDAEDLRGQVYTAIHEFHHAMGFSSSAWPLFRDANGSPRTARDPAQRSIVAPANRLSVTGACAGGGTATVSRASSSTVEYFAERGIAKCTTDTEQLTNGGCVARMVTPEARARAREYFNCPTLAGAELENQRTSSACAVAGSHLEQRVHNQNFMAPVTSHWSVITPVEMGIMQDSGWYVANYSAADAMSGEWGYQAGCPMAEDTCIRDVSGSKTSVPDERGRAHFCTEISASGTLGQGDQYCTVDRRAVGYCTGQDGLTGVPSYFQYFASADEGSVSPQQLDICPQVLAFNNLICSDAAQNSDSTPLLGILFGEGSRCASSSLQSKAQGVQRHPGVGCYLTRCLRSALQPSELIVVQNTEGLPDPNATHPWLLLGAADPSGNGVVHYAACGAGDDSSEVNPAPSLFEGGVRCMNPQVYCTSGRTQYPLVLPSPSPSPGPTPSVSPSPKPPSAQDEGGFLGTGVESQYVYIGAGVLAVLIFLGCVRHWCCSGKSATAPATSGGRALPGEPIRLQVAANRPVYTKQT